MASLMREGYLEPQDRPLVYPYERTIDDWSDLHEALDQGVRSLGHDAAILNQTIRSLKPEVQWLEAWRLCGARVSVTHDGDKIVIGISGHFGIGGHTVLMVDPFDLLINYHHATPMLFERVVRCWIDDNAAPLPPITTTLEITR
jgi:hypothetical protein